MSDQRSDVLAKLDIVALLTKEGVDLIQQGSGSQYVALCPFHQDERPSFSIDATGSGLWLCFGCGKKGSIFDFYMLRHAVPYEKALHALAEIAGVELVDKVAPLSDADVDKWVAALWKNERMLTFLHDERGLTDETIREYKLGWTGERITIPIYDAAGALVNVRKYKPHARKSDNKVTGVTGRNHLRLFPATFDHSRPVVIAEGELDTIFARQESFNAITPTGGTGKWDVSWNEAFTGVDIVLAQDHDNEGQTGQHRIMLNGQLREVVKTARVLIWPDNFKDKGDITDFLLEHPREDLQVLIDAAKPWTAPESISLPDFPLSDIGNGQRLISAHGTDLRYVALWKNNGWLKWDERRWKRDEVLVVELIAQELLLRATIDAEKSLDEGLGKWLKGSQSMAKLTAMLDAARSRAPLATHPSELDQNPWLLTCLNGTLDLRTGHIQPSRREDLITMCAPVEYNPSARSPAWQKLLDAATDGDVDLQQFLKRAIGYSLTGRTTEEKFFYIWGPTSSGKSTFLEALKRSLGDYASTADSSTFTEKRESEELKGQVADMRGKRLVATTEVEDGKSMAESFMKKLTGGDTIKARHLFEEGFEFEMTAKIWIAANSKLRLDDDDPAFWRRVLLVPFDKTIANPDPKIKEELIDPARSGAAILAWAVEGCMEWQQGGLGESAKVTTATQAYRAEQDPFVDWLEERVVEHETGHSGMPELYASYSDWARSSGLRNPRTLKTLTDRLTKKHEMIRDASGKTIVKGLVLRIARIAEEERRF